MACKGWRRSWLAAARKRDLSRSACSAASCAARALRLGRNWLTRRSFSSLRNGAQRGLVTRAGVQAGQRVVHAGQEQRGPHHGPPAMATDIITRQWRKAEVGDVAPSGAPSPSAPEETVLMMPMA